MEALKAYGYDATFQTWAGVGHGISPEMRQELGRLVHGAGESASP